MSEALKKAAQAVLDRWDSPQWKWAKHGPTADLMADLRAALADPQQAQAPGWQIVPVEPTPEMWEAWDKSPYYEDGNLERNRAWAAMLAAAPQQGAKTAEQACIQGLRNVIAEDTKNA